MLSALTDEVPRWICFDPSLDGQVYQVPIGSHVIGPNKTIDGRDADVLWQFGTPNAFKGPNSIPSPNQFVQLLARKGNLIIHCVRARGDLAPGTDLGSINGSTEFLTIQAGENYWIDHNEIFAMSDESLNVYHNDLPKETLPNHITLSYNKVHDSSNGSIVGSQHITNTRLISHVTQAFNWYHDLYGGRATGLYHNVNAHVYNNLAERYQDDGLVVRNNAQVLSESNVLNPNCTKNQQVGVQAQPPASGKLSAADGLISSINDFVNLNTDCAVTYNNSQNKSNALRFSVPYKYSLLRGTTAEQAIRDFVMANAGRLDKSQNFYTEK